MNYLDKLSKKKRSLAIKTANNRSAFLRRINKNNIDHILEIPINDAKELSNNLHAFVDGAELQIKALFGGEYYQVKSEELKKLKKDLNKYRRYARLIKTLKVNERITVYYNDLLYYRQILRLLKDVKVKEVLVLIDFSDKRTNSLDKALKKFEQRLEKMRVFLYEVKDT